MGKIKTSKLGIKNAIIFYEEAYTGVPRMVLFGDVRHLLPFYTRMTKLGFERLRNIYQAIFKRTLDEKEILDLLDGFKPDLKNDLHKIPKEATMDLTYEYDEELTKHGKVNIKDAN